VIITAGAPGEQLRWSKPADGILGTHRPSWPATPGCCCASRATRGAPARHAASLGITERSAHGIVTGLAQTGRIVKQEDGRRNHYQSPGTPATARTHPAATTFGEVLALLAETGAGLLTLPVRRRKVLAGVISEYDQTAQPES